MSSILAWLITILVAVILISFILQIVSLRSLPTNERPRTATYDRFGSLIGLMPNPDYHENPGETQVDEADPSPRSGRLP